MSYMFFFNFLNILRLQLLFSNRYHEPFFPPSSTVELVGNYSTFLFCKWRNLTHVEFIEVGNFADILAGFGTYSSTRKEKLVSLLHKKQWVWKFAAKKLSRNIYDRTCFSDNIQTNRMVIFGLNDIFLSGMRA